MVIDHPRVVDIDFLTQEYRNYHTQGNLLVLVHLSHASRTSTVHQPRLVVETLGLFLPSRMVQKRRQEEETLRIRGIKNPWAVQLDVGNDFCEATSKQKCFFESSKQITTCNPSKMNTFFAIYIQVALLKRLIHKFEQNTEFYDSAQNTRKLQRPTSQQCSADPFAPQVNTLGFLVPIAHLQTSPLRHKFLRQNS